MPPTAILGRVIRIAGVMAVLASVALAALLIARTHTAEFAGPVSGPPPDSKPGPAFSPAPPNTRPVWILQQGEPTDQQVERQVMAGINSSSSGSSEGNNPMTMYWGFQIPDEAARSAQVGDEMIIRAKSFYPPGVDGLVVTHIKYELRRGSKTMFFGEPANGKFSLVCGLFVGAPLILWGLAAGVASLWALIPKTPKPA